jgi:hypothetical protein
LEDVKRGRGRPTVGERVPLGLRVTPDLKRKLDAAAEQSGRSQSQEAELRLEHTFDRQGLLSEVLTLTYGKETAVDLMWLGAVLKLYEQDRGEPSKEWTDFISSILDKSPAPERARRIAAALEATTPLARRKAR